MNSIVKKSLLLGLSLITFGGFGLSKEVKAAPNPSNPKSVGLLGSVSGYLPRMKKEKKRRLTDDIIKNGKGEYEYKKEFDKRSPRK